MTSPRVHLLPVSLGTIVMCTAIPVELRAPAMEHLFRAPNGMDVMMNILLYALLGSAIYRLPMPRVGLIAAVLSLTIELLQLFFVGRFSSPWDLVSNIGGALLGALLTKRLLREADPAIEVSARFGIALVVFLSGFLYLMGLPGEPTTLTGWDSSADFVAGQEADGTRTWRGDVHSVGVSRSCLSARWIHRLKRLGPEALPEEAFDWSLTYRAAVDEHRPSSIPLGQSLLEARDRADFFHRFAGGETISVLAWFTPANFDQSGPARIVTYSIDPWRRNFTLAQERERLVFRIRTPASGPNGTRPEVRTSRMRKPSQPTLAVATFDGRVARVFVNAQLTGRENIQAQSRVFPGLADSGLPVSTALCTFSLAIGGMIVFRPKQRRHALVIGATAGVGGAALLVASGGASALPEFQPVMTLVGALYGLMVAAAWRDDSGDSV